MEEKGDHGNVDMAAIGETLDMGPAECSERDLINIKEVIVAEMLKISQKKWHRQNKQNTLNIKRTLGYISSYWKQTR